MKTFILLLVVALPAIFVSAEDEDSNLYEVMDSDPMDKTFLGAIDTAQLKDVFTQKGKMYTVFVPDEEAFSKMKAEDKEASFRDNTKLAKLVHNHVVTSGHPMKDLVDGFKFKTMDNQEITVSRSGTVVSLHLPNGKVVIVKKPDVKAENGYIHVIDHVMF